MSEKPGFFDNLLSGVFGDSKRPDAQRPDLAVPMLAHWLPYRSYDPKTGIFYNSASRGFVIEVSPLVGADERTGEILTQFLSEGIPAPGCLQFHDWMSPRISERLSKWYLPRYSASGVYERMAKHRVDFLTDGVWSSLSADAPFCLRNHRVAISYSTPENSSVSNEEIVAVMEGLISVLGSIGVSARKMDPVALIGWIDDITSPTTAAGEDVVSYNPLDPISDQAVRRDIEMKIDPDRILLRTERFRPTGKEIDGAPEIGEIYPDVFDVRSFSVRNLPQRWAPWDCARLIGDMFADKLRMPCPVSTNLCLDFPDPQAATNKASYKFMRTTSLADSKSARFLPQLRDQSQEWKFVNDEIRQGRKLVRLFYSVTSFSPKGKGDSNERILKSVYRAAGWDLLDDRYLQVMGLLCAMPMTMANGLSKDLERMKRMRTMLSTTAANLAPIQGEYLGGHTPHLLLIGRRGQPFFWSPFENAAGNHNVAVFGKSGSGKSVALQELCASLCGAGSKVVVIDDGRSFEHSAKLQGGAFVEFTMSSGFCLNPIAQAACAGDCVAGTANLPLDSLFWCAGCQGPMYPLNGNVPASIGHVQSSRLALSRFAYKMHREGLAWGTMGSEGLCKKYLMPIMRKQQYRFQMVNPIPTVSGRFACSAIGASTMPPEAGRAFPAGGEDMGYLVWRKRNCCVL